MSETTEIPVERQAMIKLLQNMGAAHFEAVSALTNMGGKVDYCDQLDKEQFVVDIKMKGAKLTKVQVFRGGEVWFYFNDEIDPSLIAHHCTHG